MKAYQTYKKIMDVIALIEKIAMAVVLAVITLITFGNVLSRYVLPTSWSFTEELVINIFVLLSFLGAALSARDEGGLVSMALLNNLLSKKGQRILNIIVCVIGLVFCYVMIKYGFDRVGSLIKNGKTTDVLRISEWKFALAVPVCSIFLDLHTIESAIDNIVQLKREKKDKTEAPKSDPKEVEA